MKRKITAKEQYTTYASFPLVSGDVRAYEICLDLGSDVSGVEFKVTAIRPDGVVIEDIGSVEEGIARYTMASNMYSVQGELTVRLAVLHEGSVLTDREIIFQVLENAEKTDVAETVTTINDSVILRIGTLEQKLSDKVDKEEGKGLSSNDFTDEHMQKLDDLSETIESEVEKISEDVDNLSDEMSEHKQSADNPHKVTAEQVGAYTKGAVNEKLATKADKSDITNVYKYIGSVAKFSDLPAQYPLIPNGVPTFNGEPCGIYDEETHTVTVNEVILNDPDTDRIVIPIVPINIKAGQYSSAYCFAGNAYIGDFCTYDPLVQSLEGGIVDHIEIFIPWGEETIEDSSNNMGYLQKVIDNWINEYDWSEIPEGAYDNGTVYNVLEDGMNYAWNGTDWDALGGEHKDIEAREMIGELIDADNQIDEKFVGIRDNISTLEMQLGDIESALDSIIDIQNSLIGGGSV